MLGNLRTKTETTSEICWEKSCNWVSMRPKAGSAGSSDSGASPSDESAAVAPTAHPSFPSALIGTCERHLVWLGATS